jgi:hypothetical protein
MLSVATVETEQGRQYYSHGASSGAKGMQTGIAITRESFPLKESVILTS